MALSTIILCAVCALTNVRHAQSVSSYPKLLVVSYDGFRYVFSAFYNEEIIFNVVATLVADTITSIET